MKFLVPGLFVLAVMIVVLPNTASYGQQSPWSIPEKISAKGMTSWFPDVATDPSGSVHIAWSSAITPYDMVYYMTIFPDKTRLDPIEIRARIASFGSEVTRPALYATMDGLLHLTYRVDYIFYSNAPLSLAHSFRAWQPDTQISEGYFSRMAVDSKNKLHLIYTRNVISGNCQECFHVFYRWSTDSGLTWSNEIDVSRGPLGAAKPQIIIDEDDNLHAVWEAGYGGGLGQLLDTDPTQVMYASSYDGGKTWEMPLQLSPADMVTKNITIGEDVNRNLVVAWIDTADDTIYFQVSTDKGRSWPLPAKMPGILGSWTQYHGRTDDYAMARDSGGNVHFVFSGRLPAAAMSPTSSAEAETGLSEATPTVTPTAGAPKSQLSVIHMTWNGRSWSDPDVIDTFVGDVPEWPRIAVGLGNQLHVVWFTRVEKDIWKGGGDYTIWYATRKVNAPLINPILLPTPIASETPEVSLAAQAPLLTETPETSVSFSSATLEAGNKLVYQEMDYLSIAGISTLPVIFFLFLFILVAKKLKK